MSVETREAKLENARGLGLCSHGQQGCLGSWDMGFPLDGEEKTDINTALSLSYYRSSSTDNSPHLPPKPLALLHWTVEAGSHGPGYYMGPGPDRVLPKT